MIIDERSASTVTVLKVGGLISAAWPVRADKPAKQDTSSQLDVRESEGATPAWRSVLPRFDG